MYVYIALDCTLRTLVANNNNTNKFDIVTQFVGQLVERFDKSDVSIKLVALDASPRIVHDGAKTRDDVTRAFST